MSKFLQITIVLLYILFSTIIFFDTLFLFGVKFSMNAKIELTATWTIFCFLSHWFMADFHLFRWLPVRKPILAEEQKLERLFAPILQDSGFSKRVKLRITEEMNLNAFAIGRRTISISRKMLRDFSGEELQGVLAHELGHLTNMDSIISTAYIMARNLPFPFYFALPIFLNKKLKKYFILRPVFIIYKFIELGTSFAFAF